MDKQTVIHPDDGMLFSAKKKWAIKPWKDMGNITHITEWKKQNCKDYITCDSNYITFWKKKNYGDNTKIKFTSSGSGSGKRQKQAEHRKF